MDRIVTNLMHSCIQVCSELMSFVDIDGYLKISSQCVDVNEILSAKSNNNTLKNAKYHKIIFLFIYSYNQNSRLSLSLAHLFFSCYKKRWIFRVRIPKPRANVLSFYTLLCVWQYLAHIATNNFALYFLCVPFAARLQFFSGCLHSLKRTYMKNETMKETEEYVICLKQLAQFADYGFETQNKCTQQQQNAIGYAKIKFCRI